MRNRGIEICVLGPQEEEYNSLDMRSLLYHVGLRSQTQQDILLSVHQVMNIEQGEGRHYEMSALVRRNMPKHGSIVYTEHCYEIMLHSFLHEFCTFFILVWKMYNITNILLSICLAVFSVLFSIEMFLAL
jgi:hypothetical protein